MRSAVVALLLLLASQSRAAEISATCGADQVSVLCPQTITEGSSVTWTAPHVWNGSSLTVLGSSMTIAGGPLTVRTTAGNFVLHATTSTNNRGLVVGGPASGCPGCVGIGTPSTGGIGTLTAALNLQVNGSAQVGSANASGALATPLFTQNPNTPAVNNGRARLGLRVGTTAKGVINMGTVVGLVEDVATGDGALVFETSLASTATERGRFTSQGNFGVGTASPTARVHVSTGGIISDGTNAALTVVGSSVNASAFFGDASHMTGYVVFASSGVRDGENPISLTIASTSTFIQVTTLTVTMRGARSYEVAGTVHVDNGSGGGHVYHVTAFDNGVQIQRDSAVLIGAGDDGSMPFLFGSTSSVAGAHTITLGVSTNGTAAGQLVQSRQLNVKEF